MEGYKQPEGKTYTAEHLLERYEAGRIQPSEGFADVYADYDRDMERVYNLQQSFRAQGNQAEMLGPVGEALVYDRIKSGIFGSGIDVRPASLYDDYMHGADLLVEAQHFQEPIVSTIDVTLNQKDIKAGARAPHFSAEENARPIGLDEKLKRVRRHIDYVSNINPGDARSLGAWLQGGGMHERANEGNKKYFNMAERAMLLKYYVTPEFSDDPNISRYVLGGPQVVLSLDLPFVNRVLSDKTHRDESIAPIDTILQAEMGYGIGALQGYLDKKVSESQNRNFIFDSHYTATKAWADLFVEDEQREILEKAVSFARANRDVGAQIGYYMNTYSKAFG